MAGILPAGAIPGQMKGLDANRYATKKTVAQGMLDIALLTSNASQLKYVLQVGNRHDFYTVLVVLISISIILQLLVGLLFVVIGGLDLNDDDDRPSAVVLNDVIVLFIFVISVINIVISAFGMEYSNNPLILERLHYVSAGVLTMVISRMADTQNGRRNKLADWLYHISVGMMTGVVFCDVIKMTFGLDPALSFDNFYGNKTDMNVLSAVVAIILGYIFDINHAPHHRNAELLNNISLIFKVFSITVNILISIFYSIYVDMIEK